MESIFGFKGKLWNSKKSTKQIKKADTLVEAQINSEYIIQNIKTENVDIQNFLFTLGCYAGEKITLISVLAGQFVIVVKDARYSIDKDLAYCIGI